MGRKKRAVQKRYLRRRKWAAVLVALLLRRKAYPFALVLAPGALLWLTLMLAAPVAFGVRYAYLLLAGFPLIPVVPVLAGNKNQQEEK